MMNNEFYRVIKIISEYRIVINAGKNDYITEDSIFEIFVSGSPVIDPETGEELGTLDYVKARLKVVDLFEKICVCTNIKTKSVISNSMLSALTAFEPTTREIVQELNVNTEDISGGYENINKKICVGDTVRLAD